MAARSSPLPRPENEVSQPTPKRPRLSSSISEREQDEADTDTASSPRHDPRASKACDHCRLRKVRCDAKRPRCTGCQKLDLDCQFNGTDLRKMRFSKKKRNAPSGAGTRLDRLNLEIPEANTSHSSPRLTPSLLHPSSVSSDLIVSAPAHSSHQPSVPPLTSGHSAQAAVLSQELIEALSGKVAWFDELADSQSQSHRPRQPEDAPTTSTNTTSSSSTSTSPRSFVSHHSRRSNSTQNRVIQLHYFRSFSGPTAVTRGLKKISLTIKVPPELESMLIEAQNRTALFHHPSALSDDFDPQLLNLDSLLGTSRLLANPQMLNSPPNIPPLAALPPLQTSSSSNPSCASLVPSICSSFDGDLPCSYHCNLLLKTFFSKLGDHFPFLSKTALMDRISTRRIDLALINAMCALAARFVPDSASEITTDPSASPIIPTKPHSLGLVYAEKAKSYIMLSITCPSISTVATLVLLAWHEFAVNSEGGLWMFGGMSLRMAVDLGLHRKTQSSLFGSSAGHASDIIDRHLLFWSVFMLDRTLSIGTGRPTTLKDREITVEYPPTVWHDGKLSIFAHLTRLMQKAGALAEIANNLHDEENLKRPLAELDHLEASMIRDYDQLPESLHLGLSQLRQSQEPRCLLSLHLYFHNLLILMNRMPLSRLRANPASIHESRHILQHSSQQIRDSIIFADSIDPDLLLCCPFTNQSFCVAGCVELSEAALLRQSNMAPSSRRRKSVSARTMWDDTTRNQLRGPDALLHKAKIDAYDRCVDALDRLTESWLGCSWIANALRARRKEDAPNEANVQSSSTRPSGASGGETLLSLSELQVLLRLTGGNVSITDQASDRVAARPGDGGGESRNTDTENDRASIQQPHSHSRLEALADLAHRTTTSIPSANAPHPNAHLFDHWLPSSATDIQISDVNHPDDLLNFLPSVANFHLSTAASASPIHSGASTTT